MKSTISFVLALLLSHAAAADETTRQAKIEKIIAAQGLHQVFQEQLDQARQSAADVGRTVVKKVLAEAGIPEGQENPRLNDIFRNYMERWTQMFTARELVETWARLYGPNLSEADLDLILAYYQSAVGQKDVIASQAAAAAFGRITTRLGQERMGPPLEQLMRDLKTLR